MGLSSQLPLAYAPIHFRRNIEEALLPNSVLRCVRSIILKRSFNQVPEKWERYVLSHISELQFSDRPLIHNLAVKLEGSAALDDLHDALVYEAEFPFSDDHFLPLMVMDYLENRALIAFALTCKRYYGLFLHLLKDLAYDHKMSFDEVHTYFVGAAKGNPYECSMSVNLAVWAERRRNYHLTQVVRRVASLAELPIEKQGGGLVKLYPVSAESTQEVRDWFNASVTAHPNFEFGSFTLAACSLNYVPMELYQLVWLRHLDLSHNHLHELPKEFEQLENLEWLSLNSNRFRNVPCHIKVSQMLMRDNFIRILPRVPRCRSIDLRGNLVDLSSIQHITHRVRVII